MRATRPAATRNITAVTTNIVSTLVVATTSPPMAGPMRKARLSIVLEAPLAAVSSPGCEVSEGSQASWAGRNTHPTSGIRVASTSTTHAGASTTSATTAATTSTDRTTVDTSSTALRDSRSTTEAPRVSRRRSAPAAPPPTGRRAGPRPRGRPTRSPRSRTPSRPRAMRRGRAACGAATASGRPHAAPARCRRAQRGPTGAARRGPGSPPPQQPLRPRDIRPSMIQGASGVSQWPDRAIDSGERACARRAARAGRVPDYGCASSSRSPIGACPVTRRTSPVTPSTSPAAIAV